MNRGDTAHASRAERWLYALLAGSVAIWMIARICVVSNKDGTTPFQSANDRSRWATIRALVDEHTYALDGVILTDLQTWENDPDWDTIDKVYHLGPDGQEHFYSSKPPLLTTLLAGEYWCLQRVTGWTLKDQPFAVARTMLVLSNVLPMLLYFFLLAQLLERYGTSIWARGLIFAAATWGTFLTTFAVTLNNHHFAAISVAVALWAAAPIWHDGDGRRWRFALAGLAAAFAAANELPALSFLLVMTLALAWRSIPRTLLAFVPMVGLVAATFFGTNYLAHGTIKLAYESRQDGPPLCTLFNVSLDDLATGNVTPAVRDLLAASSARITSKVGEEIWEIDEGRRWSVFDGQTQRRYVLEVAEQNDLAGQARRLPEIGTGANAGHGKLADVIVRLRGNWYIFPGSYWLDSNRSPIDQGEPSISVYAFHVLLGHHGLFSLTPFWLLAAVGLGMSVYDGRGLGREFAMMVVMLTLICLAFYLSRPLIDRNYGGQTSGLRWMFWFAPLWILGSIPAVEKLVCCWWGRALVLLVILASAISAAYSWQNPWVHPWIYAKFYQ